MKQYLEAGKIVTTHGIKGEVRIYPWCDSADTICELKRLYLDANGARGLDISAARNHKNMAVVKFKGFDTIEDSRRLVEKTVYLCRDDVKLPEGRFFISDLIGLSVRDAETGETYGTVSDVSNLGAHDIYHVKMADGTERMIPAVPAIVVGHDLDAGVILVKPIEGMFNDAD